MSKTWKEIVGQKLTEEHKPLVNELEKNTAKIIATFNGTVSGIGNEFTNSRGNLQQAVVIKLDDVAVARSLEKYSPAVSVNGNTVTIFVHPVIAAKASIDGLATVCIDQRIKDVTVYKDKLKGSYEYHTQDGYGVGTPQFEASAAEKAIEITKKKAATLSEDATIKHLQKLAAAGINVAFNL